MNRLTLTFVLTITALAFASGSSNRQLIEQLNETFKKNETPVTFTTPEMIAKAKTRVEAKSEPWYGNYKRIKEYADASLERKIVPYTSVEVRHKQPDGVHETANTDFAAARDCGLVWHIEDDEKYLAHAKKILLEWARAKPEPIVHLESENDYPYYDANLGLMAAAPMVFYSHAYTIIYDQFTPEEHEDIKLWLNKVAYKLKLWHLAWTASSYYGNQYYNNHLSWHNAGIGYIGFALQDAEMAAHAIDDTENPRDFKEMIEGAILMPGDKTHDGFDQIIAGEIYDRYRHNQNKGINYAMYHGMALSYLAEAAYNNGIDLYAYTAAGGENLGKMYSFYAEFIAKEDSTLRHGFYEGDRIPTSYAQMYDLMNTRYPGNPEFIEVLKAHGRYTHHKGKHTSTIGLTHAEPLN